MATRSLQTAFNGGNSARGVICTAPSVGSPAENTTALNSSYVYGTSGNCFSFIFVPFETGTLTDLWLKVSSYSGTWASTDGVVNIEIREGLNGSNKPGTTVTGSFTWTLDGSTTGWVKKTGISISLTAGQIYNVVIADVDGGATNFVTFVRGYNNLTSGYHSHAVGTRSTNGYSSGTLATEPQTYVLKQNGTLYSGGNFSSATLLSGNNVVERGVRFKCDDPMTLIGALTTTDVLLTGSIFKLYNDATAPGGSTLLSVTKPTWVTASAATPVLSWIPFGSSGSYDIIPNTWYRFVTLPPSNTQAPRKYLIGGSPDADVLAASIPFGGNCYHTLQSGSTWVDETSSGYAMNPVLVPTTRPTISC